MKASYVFAAVLLALAVTAEGSPVFDIFFGNPRGDHRNYGQRQRPTKGRSYSSEGGYNEYKRICKVLQPDPYAFIGSNPYPGSPFCPP